MALYRREREFNRNAPLRRSAHRHQSIGLGERGSPRTLRLSDPPQALLWETLRMVRAFRWAVFRDVAGACRPPASPERARHSPSIGKRHPPNFGRRGVVRPEDRWLKTKMPSCKTDRAMPASWHGATVLIDEFLPPQSVVKRTMRSACCDGEGE